jgi:hypothetical protein
VHRRPRRTDEGADSTTASAATRCVVLSDTCCESQLVEPTMLSLLAESLAAAVLDDDCTTLSNDSLFTHVYACNQLSLLHYFVCTSKPNISACKSLSQLATWWRA